MHKHAESKWELQIGHLADAYLAWKDGSSAFKTTDEEFTVQYVNTFGKYCLLYLICYLMPLRLLALKGILSYPRPRLRILECYSPSPQLPCANSWQDLDCVFNMHFRTVPQATTTAHSTLCAYMHKGHLWPQWGTYTIALSKVCCSKSNRSFRLSIPNHSVTSWLMPLMLKILCHITKMTDVALGWMMTNYWLLHSHPLCQYQVSLSHYHILKSTYTQTHSLKMNLHLRYHW